MFFAEKYVPSTGVYRQSKKPLHTSTASFEELTRLLCTYVTVFKNLYVIQFSSNQTGGNISLCLIVYTPNNRLSIAKPNIIDMFYLCYTFKQLFELNN